MAKQFLHLEFGSTFLLVAPKRELEAVRALVLPTPGHSVLRGEEGEQIICFFIALAGE
jgi:hypothetical protein